MPCLSLMLSPLKSLFPIRPEADHRRFDAACGMGGPAYDGALSRTLEVSMPIDRSEEEDVRASLQRAGYDRNDFEFQYARLDNPVDGGIYNLHENVTVTRRSTGISHTFMGGTGKRWAADAEEAVARHAWGPPSR